MLSLVLFQVFTAPWLLVGGGMIVVGILALGPRKDIAELWICLPGGLAMLGLLAAAIYYAFVWLPALTICRFSFDGQKLVLATPKYCHISTTIGDLRSLTEARNRRSGTGRKLKGWWLRLDSVGLVYLSRQTENAELLVSQLRSALPGKAKDRIS